MTALAPKLERRRRQRNQAMKGGKSPRPKKRPKPLAVQAKAGEPKDTTVEASMALSPLYQHATLAGRFVPPALGFKEPINLMDCCREISAVIDKVKSGDLAKIEEMLIAQAVSLNGLYVNLVTRSTQFTNQHSEGIAATETFLRLAYKAQAQSRANLEALIELKLPRPIAFVNQANIAGQQQINNGLVPPGVIARATDNRIEPSKLNQETAIEPLERRGQGAPVSQDPSVAAVEGVNRATH